MSAKRKDQQILSPLVCSSLRSALHLENKKTTSDIKTRTCDPGLSPSSWGSSIQPGQSYFPNPNGLGASGSSLQESGAPSRDKPHPRCWFCSRCAENSAGQLLSGCISCLSITLVPHSPSQTAPGAIPGLWLQRWGLPVLR